MFVHKPRSRAFTLVEMLTVMAVISTLMAILLPAVNHVREIGRRTMCASNMRQFALAANVYHSIQNAYPAGQVGCPRPPGSSLGQIPDLMFRTSDDCVGPNWLALLLVHLDEKGLSDALVKCVGTRNRRNALNDCDAVFKSPVPSYFVCPSAPSELTTSTSSDTSALFKIGGTAINKGNYAGCWGMERYYNLQQLPPGQKPGTDSQHFDASLYAAQMDGIFGYVYAQRGIDPTTHQPSLTDGLFKMGHGKGTRIDYMTDGPSKTIMISEVVGFDSSADCRGAWFWGAMGASAFTTKLPPNAAYSSTNRFTANGADLRDLIPGCASIPTSSRYDQWLTCQNGGGATDYAAARSGHPGGVNVAMGDSSTRFISDGIDENIWKAASTKSGFADKESGYPLPPAF